MLVDTVRYGRNNRQKLVIVDKKWAQNMQQYLSILTDISQRKIHLSAFTSIYLKIMQEVDLMIILKLYIEC